MSLIRHIETWHESVPLTRPYSIANKSFTAVELFFVRITTDDGFLGLGSAAPAEFVTGESETDCQQALAPERLAELVGRDPLQQPALGRVVAGLLRHTPAAHAAVDMALLDLWGRCLDKPLVALLGQFHDGLATSITIGIRSLAETLSEADEYVGRGFRHLKVKIGASIDEDLERLARLRETLGPEVLLRVDANQGYARQDLVRLLAAAQELELELVEQPLPVEAEKDLSVVPEESRRILAADEALIDSGDALRLADEANPYGIFNIKLMKCGGVNAALAISRIAEAARRDLMWGCMDESRISIAAALHAAYACRRTRYLDLDGSFDLARDPAEGGFKLEDGRLYLTTRPGLGVRLRS